MSQEVQTPTLIKGDIIYGNFNVQVNAYHYQKCMCAEYNSKTRFIPLNDICTYEIELFKYADSDIIDMLSVYETLSNDEKQFTRIKFLSELKKNSNFTIYMNQIYFEDFIENDKSQFYFKYNEGIVIKDKLIPIYLLPQENKHIFLIDNSDKNSYICFK